MLGLLGILAEPAAVREPGEVCALADIHRSDPPRDIQIAAVQMIITCSRCVSGSPYSGFIKEAAAAITSSGIARRKPSVL